MVASTICIGAGGASRTGRTTRRRRTTITLSSARKHPQLPVKVCLKRGKARLFRQDKHPLVYSGAVDRIEGRQPKDGDMVYIADGAGEIIGWGAVNMTSIFRVRVFVFRGQAEAGGSERRRKSSGDNDDDDADSGGDDQSHQEHPHREVLDFDLQALVYQRLADAIRLRRTVLGLPSEQTSFFRLFNSEGDGLSGLIVDVYNDVAVVQSSAAWVEIHRDLIEAALLDLGGQGGISIKDVLWLRNEKMLNLEGISVARDPAARAQEPIESEAEDDKGQFTAVENGIRYQVDPLKGQKTGLYSDQRENRHWLARMIHQSQPSQSSPARVLDLCTYTGGFAISAAKAGADVLGVDSSKYALECARWNAQLNDVVEKTTLELSDIEAFMKRSVEKGIEWDFVVLDPPKLAPSKKDLNRAARKYIRLNSLAIQLVRPGGVLLTCSCSGAVTQDHLLESYVSEASKQTRRSLKMIRQAGAAPDHLISPFFSEGQYLSCLTFVCD